MVGGDVIETIDVGDKIWINCRERHATEECAIYVVADAKARCVEPGDGLWWQGAAAFWTPRFVRERGKPHSLVDVPIKRVGCSGVSRPTLLESHGEVNDS